ncbi:MAG: hypothetical protein OER87_05880 [Gammaproteobacteria bacterium]|nr:hypothetical protein [Gammaproteobacteria bacterium]
MPAKGGIHFKNHDRVSFPNATGFEINSLARPGNQRQWSPARAGRLGAGVTFLLSLIYQSVFQLSGTAVVAEGLKNNPSATFLPSLISPGFRISPLKRRN